jgi:aldehyde dehydrogenase (NAD+)
MGAGHGRAGFDTFSHLKPVLKNHFTLLPLLFPPYTGRVKRLKEWALQLVK